MDHVNRVRTTCCLRVPIDISHTVTVHECLRACGTFIGGNTLGEELFASQRNRAQGDRNVKLAKKQNIGYGGIEYNTLEDIRHF